MAGHVAPDGRPAQAKGIGKTAKRHDLEQPKTPGLAGSDLQQGDVQKLEQGQKVAPIPNQKPQAKAAPGSNAQGQSGVEVPDAIDFLGKRFGGGNAGNNPGTESIDLTAWMPLLRRIARNPGKSGPLATALVQALSNFSQTPAAGRVRVMDENAITQSIRASVE